MTTLSKLEFLTTPYQKFQADCKQCPARIAWRKRKSSGNQVAIQPKTPCFFFCQAVESHCKTSEKQLNNELQDFRYIYSEVHHQSHQISEEEEVGTSTSHQQIPTKIQHKDQVLHHIQCFSIFQVRSPTNLAHWITQESSVPFTLQPHSTVFALNPVWILSCHFQLQLQLPHKTCLFCVIWEF